ncbi:MAG: PGPGW domain-containing protein [Trichlorobacter sp.]|uniref:PGPGW domain-containing protein n=1 Tax=Trichlorobacter sp. TaxID=2911007 RepID=UPI0025666A3D|nr:PGPGW domain-containing protein [Trichlorobacter sp.]MDK9716418.1 PGPGW domain-containing protein [Trichlorobacter sp.]
MLHWTLRKARQMVVGVVGVTVVIIGIIMIFTPGPAIVVIPLGLGILASEFVWARDLLHKVKTYIETKTNKKKNQTEESP